jgi:hypothetical protein
MNLFYPATSKGYAMTLQTSDFIATHDFLVNCDYKAESNETAAARARSEGGANELLKAQLLSGVAPTSFSPGTAAHPMKSENPANEVLPADPASEKAP